MSQLRVAVVGGSGYIGGELVRLLLQHTAVELASSSYTPSVPFRVTEKR